VRTVLVIATLLVLPSGLVRIARAAEERRPDREAAALEFVRANHPELADLLDQLKAMKPEEYDRAINELWQVSRTLANFQKNEQRRYEPALDVWKSRSRAQLLAAQFVDAPSPALEARLREALKTQVEAELHQQKVEREIVRDRLQKIDEAIDRLESRSDKVVESRYQALLRKGQRARRLETGSATRTPSAAVKKEKGENP
jgi:hypothetical protein